MLLEFPPRRIRRALPVVSFLLFVILRFASPLGLSHAIVKSPDHYIWAGLKHSGAFTFLEFLALAAIIITLLVAFFMVLGGLVGEFLRNCRPLPGYALNLAGSLAGILIFTLLAYLHSPPAAWLLIGFLLLLFLVPRDWKLAASFACTLVLVALPQPNVFWSPYYRIDMGPSITPAGWSRIGRQDLEVNHDYHQRMLDLSPEFIARYSSSKVKIFALGHYDLPYHLVAQPTTVLVVGAGTGNDLAAALRHHAQHVDAVEIDPVILDIGRARHPEQPYSSPLITTHVEDARAFFKKTTTKYDLIIFGLLDSHTLSSNFSSLRLDNYVFTKESFQEARALLSPGGTLVLAAASGRSFVTPRLFATLLAAFGTAPRVFNSRYEDTLTMEFVEGGARNAPVPPGATDVTEQIQSEAAGESIATDRWPFLYLARHSIPLSILSVFAIFLIGAWMLVRSSVAIPLLTNRASVHFLLLGAGFLLLETKAVTELSLLFGSTWTVNTVVISSFLTMALLSTGIIAYWPISRGLSYVALLILLSAQLAIPYSVLTGASGFSRIFVAGFAAGLPVFFSGLIFSRSFADAPRPAQALGVNLFGAVLGGFLESTAMIGGTAVLGVLAILLYAGSAACCQTEALPTEFQARAAEAD